MRYAFIPAIAAVACAFVVSDPVTDADLLTDFSDAEVSRWEVVNDGVMGGRSEGHFVIEDGVLRFAGTLVTRGGGFTSVRTTRALDLSAYAGVELRVRGGGRGFEVNLVDAAAFRGRRISRRAAFPTSEEWSVVRVAFAELRPSFRGRALEVATIDPGAVRELGLFIADGRDGPFRLEVDWIRGYR